MEQRRLLLAFALSLGLLILYQELVLKRYQPAPSSEPPAPAARAPQPQPTSKVDQPGVVAAGLSAPVNAAATVTIDTDTLKAVITLAGGRLLELQLKGHRRAIASDSEPLDLVQPASILPATLQLAGPTSDAELTYRADRNELSVRGDQRGEVVLEADTPGGLRIEKRYGFRGSGYAFDVVVLVSGQDVPRDVGLVLTPPAPSSSGSQSRESAVVLHERKLEERDISKLPQEPVTYPNSTWAGFAAQYFLIAAMPEGAGAGATVESAQGLPVVVVNTPVVKGRASFTLYAGPKARDELVRAGHDLDRALDFGWFWFIAIPLLQALRFLHSLTGNYGVAIIVLTTLVKLATIPLTQTTFRNMREMQRIQPQMVKLRERFKDDQVALQKEMMELYRRHRVNPLSGCLPMLLQLPIFVGLYNALVHATELRHAPFALWINDLSAPDRLVMGGIGIPVLTLLMGASMFLQQWLTPQQGDPTQQRMMMFMPLVFTFMFYNFPAGLVLYWLVNNILSIGQQYMMMRTMT